MFNILNLKKMSQNKNIIIVGVGGCSRSGKSFLVKELRNEYEKINKNNSLFSDFYDEIHQDTYANYYRVMKNKVKTRKGNIYENWEFSGSLDWDNFYRDIQEKIENLSSKIKNSNKKGTLFIEGFLLFSPLISNPIDTENYLNLFDYYIYICLDKKLAKIRRMRTTTVPDDYYEDILWPEYIKNCSNYGEFLSDKKYNKNKDVLIIDGNRQYNPRSMALCILKWINVLNDFNFIDQDLYNNLFIPFDNQLNLIKKSLLST